MATKGFSIGEAIRFGWEKFKDNAVFFIILVLILGLISAITSSLQTSAQRIGPGSAFIIGLLVFAINMIIALGIINVSLKFVDTGKAGYEDIISAYSLFFTYLVSAILVALIVTVGLILFIIPGIIFAIRLQFFGFYIVDKHAEITDSLRLSWGATKGFTGQLFLFDLALLGIIILGAIALGVGLLIALPVVWVALAYVYRRLQTREEATAQVTPAA